MSLPEINIVWLNALVWYIGLAVAFVGVTTVLVVCSLVISSSLQYILAKTFKLYRVDTIRLWLNRMEEEGLKAPETHYRKLVAERNAKTPGDFIECAEDAEADR